MQASVTRSAASVQGRAATVGHRTAIAAAAAMVLRPFRGWYVKRAVPGNARRGGNSAALKQAAVTPPRSRTPDRRPQSCSPQIARLKQYRRLVKSKDKLIGKYITHLNTRYDQPELKTHVDAIETTLNEIQKEKRNC